MSTKIYNQEEKFRAIIVLSRFDEGKDRTLIQDLK